MTVSKPLPVFPNQRIAADDIGGRHTVLLDETNENSANLSLSIEAVPDADRVRRVLGAT